MDQALATRLGGAVRQARLAKGLTQAVAAELVDLTIESFGRIERGRMLPSVETLARLVAELGLSFDGVVRGEAQESVAPERPVSQLESLLPHLSKRALKALTLVAMELKSSRAEVGAETSAE